MPVNQDYIYSINAAEDYEISFNTMQYDAISYNTGQFDMNHCPTEAILYLILNFYA